MEDGKFSFFLQAPKDNTRYYGDPNLVKTKVLFTDCDDVGRTHRYVTVRVTGYDPCLAEDDALKKDLTDHFRSCGGVLRVDFGKDPESDHRCAFIKVFGERVDEKALQLSGTEFRGRKLVAKALPLVEPIFFKQPLSPFSAQISI